MKIVGCDLHTRYQQIATLEQETGELIERRLEHESGEARAFYAEGRPLLLPAIIMPLVLECGIAKTGGAPLLAFEKWAAMKPTPDLRRKRSPPIHHIQRVIAITDIARAIRNNEIGSAKAELCPSPETDLIAARRCRARAICPRSLKTQIAPESSPPVPKLGARQTSNFSPAL